MAKCAKHHVDFKHACSQCRIEEFTATAGTNLFSQKSLGKRRIELHQKPVLLNQDQFGICGMASAVYIMLRADPARFDELCDATFGVFAGVKDATFETKKGPAVIDLGNLAHFYKLMLDDGGPDLHFAIDFFVARALGQIMKQQNKALYSKQKEFSKLFDAPLAPTPMTKTGSLALQTEAIDYVITDILKGKTQIVSDVDEASLADFVEDWSKLKKPNTFVIAGVQVEDAWPWSGSKLTSVPPSTKIKVPYQHWIVITDKITSAGGAYKVPIWTWAQEQTPQLSIGVAHKWIRELIVCTL